MGTRHVIAVVKDGEFKVAQYGQCNGYPSGNGSNFLNFCKTRSHIEKLKKALDRVRFIDHNGKDKEFVEDYNKNCPVWSNDPDNRTEEQKRWHNLFDSRNLSYVVLKHIILCDDEEILLHNSIDFVDNSLMCEWAYVLDLDNETFEVYEGFNEDPDVKGRFKNYKDDDLEYYPCTLIATYSLNDLPKDLNHLNELFF